MPGIRGFVLLAATFVVVTVLISESTARPCTKQRQSEFLRYLKKYGYLEPGYEGSEKPEEEEAVKRAVRKLQRYRGLEINGEMADTETLDIVQTPRCSLSDADSTGVPKRRRRYAVHGTAWKKMDLTYKFASYTEDLSRDKVRDTLIKALSMWSDVSPLTFTEVSDPGQDADIMIDFVRGDHGDNRPADGPGRELAHAFFPLDNTGLAGDVHFDEDETFAVDDPTNAGVDLLWLAVHELGHSLGLSHSYQPDSIMFPFYIGYKPDLGLDQDDILGIQSIYGNPGGGKSGTPTPDVTLVPSPNVPRKCNTTLDTIVTSKDSRTFAFSGEYLWEIEESAGAGEKQQIQQVFPRLEPNIDAAYTSRRLGQTFFFKGKRVWIYENRRLVWGPVDMTHINLPSTLYNMDAALEWAPNGKVYFFKGEQYWRFDSIREVIDDGYPKPIVPIWRGVPANVDAALQWGNGNSYFFQGEDFHAYDDLRVRVKPGYPKAFATYWMGCNA